MILFNYLVKMITKTNNKYLNYTSSNYVECYLKSIVHPNNQFVKWIRKVEKKIISLYGFTLIDIPDEDYIRYFKSLYSPNQMVQIIIKSNGFE